MGKKLGPRVSVVFRNAKRGSKKSGKPAENATYIYVLKSTAENFGLKIVANAAIKTKKGGVRIVRGAVGAGSIKVPKDGQAGTKQLLRIPVPADATISEVQQFLRTATKNKPTTFTTRDGRSYPVVATK